MRALTVCQPYAHLIASGEKFVENRTWPTRHRGRLLIHAGKSKKYMSDGDEGRYPNMAFGAVVAEADLATCVHINDVPSIVEVQPEYGWIPTHEHTERPWLWVFSLVYKIDPPLAMTGARGLWDVDVATVRRIRETLRGQTPYLMPRDPSGGRG